MVNKDLCIGCCSCVNVCPVNAIKLGADGKAEIDKNVCIKCGTCQSICLVGAIKIEEEK